jgi:hypothetical protein
MVRILSEKIRDNRFLRLVRNMLQAGYLEDWAWYATLSGEERQCFEAVVPRQGREPLIARFGGIPLRRNRNAVPYDRVPDPGPHRHREVVRRLLRSDCEVCGHNGLVEAH